ncbi:unnamed protein product, partial [Effrenium voratum]
VPPAPAAEVTSAAAKVCAAAADYFGGAGGSRARPLSESAALQDSTPLAPGGYARCHTGRQECLGGESASSRAEVFRRGRCCALRRLREQHGRPSKFALGAQLLRSRAHAGPGHPAAEALGAPAQAGGPLHRR